MPVHHNDQVVLPWPTMTPDLDRLPKTRPVAIGSPRWAPGLRVESGAITRPLLFQATAFQARPAPEPANHGLATSAFRHCVASPTVPMEEPDWHWLRAGLRLPTPALELKQPGFQPSLAKLEITAAALFITNVLLAIVVSWQLGAPARCWRVHLLLHLACGRWCWSMVLTANRFSWCPWLVAALNNPNEDWFFLFIGACISTVLCMVSRSITAPWRNCSRAGNL